MHETNKTSKARPHIVKVRLSDEEYARLCQGADMIKRDKSKYLRQLIRWIEPVAPPSVEVTELLRELRSVGINLNQLAAKAHSLGFIDTLMYRGVTEQGIYLPMVTFHTSVGQGTARGGQRCVSSI